MCKLGDPVEPDTLLYRVHASYPADLGFAHAACNKASGFTIGPSAEIPHVFVEF
jgi:thymidine phosphorylase